MPLRPSRFDSFVLLCVGLFTLGLAVGDQLDRISPLTMQRVIGLVLLVYVAALMARQEATRIAALVSRLGYWLSTLGMFLFGAAFGLVLNWESLPKTSFLLGLGAPVLAAILTSMALWVGIARAAQSSDPAA